MEWLATEIGWLNFNKRGGQRYNKRVPAFCAAWLRDVTLAQMMKGTECDVASVTVGDDELGRLRMFGVFNR
jgi:hypothetical protein